MGPVDLRSRRFHLSHGPYCGREVVEGGSCGYAVVGYEWDDWSNAYWFWVHWAQWKTTHDEKSLAELKDLIRYFYSMPSMLRTWEQSPWGKPLMEEEFAEFVDFILSERNPKQESGT